MATKKIPGGYAGKILTVDLNQRKVKEEELSPDFLRRYLGGMGLGAKLLYDSVKPDIEAYHPENHLIFMTGPLTGTVPCGCKIEVITKSPVTKAYGEANAGGHFGPRLKMAGYDGLIIKGKSEKPVYLSITEKGVEFMEAQHLWGKDCFETVDIIREELGNKKARVACIGPGGENLVKIASIVLDKGNVAARTGVGAIMGAKNLKAIAVHGDKNIPVSDPEALKVQSREYNNIVRQSPILQYFSKHGTSGIFEPCYAIGDVPIKNFKEGVLPDYKNLGGERMTDTILLKKESCYNCPIFCKRVVKVDKEPFRMEGPGPEYEGIAALGATCGVVDLEAVAKGNDLCNRYGIDVISAGVIIAFAMECYEKGILTDKDTNGLKLEWGSVDALIPLIHRIAKREGVGDILAEGVKGAAQRIGKGSEEFALEVKGVEMPMHDPRALKSKGLGYAVSTVGARANSMTPANTWERMGFPDLMGQRDVTTLEYKVELCVKGQNFLAGFNSTGLCMFFTAFSNGVLSKFMNFFNTVTGWNMSLEEILEVGERTYNLQRVFNMNHGHTKEMDLLPRRFTHEPLKEGGAKESVVELDKMLPMYYTLREWDLETGRPKDSLLKRLGLESLVKS